jgi:uncharacterized protein (UPF0332 family)
VQRSASAIAYAKTHSGLISLFSQIFVRSGEVDAAWPARINEARKLREGGDYSAKKPTAEAATEVVADAEEFVAAIRDLFE